jgi:hypothetical protein
MWQTYTPDGIFLTIRHDEGTWLATYMDRRVEAATADEAIRGALRVETPAADPTLEEWIVEHVEALEAETG